MILRIKPDDDGNIISTSVNINVEIQFEEIPVADVRQESLFIKMS